LLKWDIIEKGTVHMKIIVTTSYNPIYNATNEIEFEMPDNATEVEIELAAQEAAFEDFDWNWEKVAP